MTTTHLQDAASALTAYSMPLLTLRAPQAGELIRLEISADVIGPARMVYDLWTRFDSVPHFMRGEEVARRLEESRCVWRINLAGRQMQWEAEHAEDVPGERIVWKSRGGRAHPNGGSVCFSVLSLFGCRVIVTAEFDLPSGSGDDDALKGLASDLRNTLDRFSNLVEAYMVPSCG
jgi:uncharacterized membrane protein